MRGRRVQLQRPVQRLALRRRPSIPLGEGKATGQAMQRWWYTEKLEVAGESNQIMTEGSFKSNVRPPSGSERE